MPRFRPRYLKRPGISGKNLINAIEQNPALVKELEGKRVNPFNKKQTINGPVYSTSRNFGEYHSRRSMDSSVNEAVRVISEGQRTGKTIKPNLKFKQSKKVVSGLPAITKPQLPAVIPKPKNIKVGDPQGRISSALNTFGDHVGIMTDSISKTGVKKFLGQSAMYGTYGAAAEAGISVLQGNDPWEGAKSGFVKGFVGGAAVKGFGHATGTVGQGFKGFATGGKRIGATYNTHRTGQISTENVSRQVKAIKNNESNVKVYDRVKSKT